MYITTTKDVTKYNFAP